VPAHWVCRGVLYHLQGVFEPVYNRFSAMHTTTCPNDQLLQNRRYPRSLWPAPAGCLSGWKAISGISGTNWQVPQDAPNRTTTPNQGLRCPCGTPVGDPMAAGRRGMTGHGRARGQIGVYPLEFAQSPGLKMGFFGIKLNSFQYHALQSSSRFSARREASESAKQIKFG
jgi:hypothetical protein